MLKFKVIFISIFLLSTTLTYADAKSELAGRNTELSQIKQNIDKKKVEKDKLLRTEKQVKKELNNISISINKNKKNLEKSEKQIKQTEQKLSVATNMYEEADNEKNLYANKIEEQCVLYNNQKLVSYYLYPFQFTIRKKSLEYNVAKCNSARNKEYYAQKDINKYNKQKNTLVNLKQKQKNLITKDKQLQEEKNKLLKTTTSKRKQTDEEIKELKNSQKALQELINKLTIQCKRQEQNKKSITSLRSKTNTRRNNLPWPVDGTIVQNYGKNKHETLNTNIISNGIKIKAKNNSIVKSIDAGTVVFVGKFRKYGKMVIIDHKGIFFSVYTQLSQITVKDNQIVKRQEQIATLGTNDKAILYFEIRQCNVCENPMLWLKEKK